MRTTVKSVRNIAFALLLLLATTAGPTVGASAAGYCDTLGFDPNWAGRCSGAADACGYYRQLCDEQCFFWYTGHYCWTNFYLCQEYNAGTEENPNYCLSEAFCECVISWP